MKACPEVTGYEILEPVGKGGMGKVYLARQLALGRKVAIKFLEPDVDVDADPETDLARFRREAELMAKVIHPNILSLFDFGEAGGRPYLVMAYVEGGDLRRRLTPGKPLSVSEVRSIVRPVAAALAYLHRNGIIHRDLKPENILLHDGIHPLVTDFGLAALQGGASSLTRTSRGLGTLGYVAPEQQYRLPTDCRADQYSLAALSYEMLTGQLPLGVFKPPSALNPSLPEAVDAVVIRALQENPKDRYEGISEFAEALDRALDVKPRAPSRWHFPIGKLAATGSAVLVVMMATWIVVVFGGLLHLRQGPASQGQVPPRPTAPPRTRKTDPLIEELKAITAASLWEQRGEPADEGSRNEIWREADQKTEEKINLIAYKIWQDSGSPKGDEGIRVYDLNRHTAARQLYRTVKGEDYQEPLDNRRADPARPATSP